MIKTRFATGLCALVACCGLAAAQDSNGKPAHETGKHTEQAQPSQQGMDPQAAAQWEAWEKTNQIGEQHVRLATDMVGQWKTVSTFWMAPGGEPIKSEGTAAFAPVLGGRFVMSDFNGDMMGQKFQGIGYYGFNTLSQKFENVWMDSASNLMMVTTGERGADNAITWTGSYPDPMTGQVKQYKAVSRFPEKGKMVYEMYDTTTDGNEFKSLEVVYTRTSAGGPLTVEQRQQETRKPVTTTPPGRSPSVKGTDRQQEKSPR